MTSANKLLMRVQDLVKHFPVHSSALFQRKKNVVHAVDGISFDLIRGETLGLVGESGCGKSTTGRTILQLYRPTSGSVVFDGLDLVRLSSAELRPIRRRMQMIFQDPYASMNPRFKIRDVLQEPLIIHKIEGDQAKHEEMIIKSLTEVKLNPPVEFMGRYPHMLSGGQRQRVATARTLILNPMMLVADEPVSMIDLSTRAEILHMMKDVQRDLGLTYLYITHDLSTARYFTDRIAVMYLGRIVEMGNADDVIDRPAHPYTRALIEAVPEPVTGQVDTVKELPISGEIPSPSNIPAGCRFHTRCPFAKAECREEAEPELMDLGAGHYHACRRWKEIG